MTKSPTRRLQATARLRHGSMLDAWDAPCLSRNGGGGLIRTVQPEDYLPLKLQNRLANGHTYMFPYSHDENEISS
jgi:hypothetical protein